MRWHSGFDVEMGASIGRVVEFGRFWCILYGTKSCIYCHLAHPGFISLLICWIVLLKSGVSRKSPTQSRSSVPRPSMGSHTQSHPTPSQPIKPVISANNDGVHMWPSIWVSHVYCTPIMRETLVSMAQKLIIGNHWFVREYLPK